MWDRTLNRGHRADLPRLVEKISNEIALKIAHVVAMIYAWSGSYHLPKNIIILLGREINDLVTENRYFRDPHVFDPKLTTEFWVS